jgi:hypothetical protein
MLTYQGVDHWLPSIGFPELERSKKQLVDPSGFAIRARLLPSLQGNILQPTAFT